MCLMLYNIMPSFVKKDKFQAFYEGKNILVIFEDMPVGVLFLTVQFQYFNYKPSENIA